jgi:hypothetical protein
MHARAPTRAHTHTHPHTSTHPLIFVTQHVAHTARKFAPALLSLFPKYMYDHAHTRTETDTDTPRTCTHRHRHTTHIHAQKQTHSPTRLLDSARGAHSSQTCPCTPQSFLNVYVRPRAHTHKPTPTHIHSPTRLLDSTHGAHSSQTRPYSPQSFLKVYVRPRTYTHRNRHRHTTHIHAQKHTHSPTRLLDSTHGAHSSQTRPHTPQSLPLLRTPVHIHIHTRAHVVLSECEIWSTCITHMHHTHASHTCITHMHHTCITHMHHTHASHTCITHMHHTHASHTCMHMRVCLCSVGLARTIYIRCIYGVFGWKITKYTVMYGMHISYIRFWPTLPTTRKNVLCSIFLFALQLAAAAATHD